MHVYLYSHAIESNNFGQLDVNQGFSRNVLLASLEEYEYSGTTQIEDVKKTPPKMLPPTLNIVCVL